MPNADHVWRLGTFLHTTGRRIACRVTGIKGNLYVIRYFTPADELYDGAMIHPSSFEPDPIPLPKP